MYKEEETKDDWINNVRECSNNSLIQMWQEYKWRLNVLTKEMKLRRLSD